MKNNEYTTLFGATFEVVENEGRRELVFNSQTLKLNSDIVLDNIRKEDDAKTHYNLSLFSKIERNKALAWNKKLPINSILGTIVSPSRFYQFAIYRGYTEEWLSSYEVSESDIHNNIRTMTTVSKPINLDAAMMYIVCERFISDRRLYSDLLNLDPNIPITSYHIKKVDSYGDRGYDQEQYIYSTDYRAKYIGMLRIIKALIHLGRFNAKTIRTVVTGLTVRENLHIFSRFANLESSVFDKFREDIQKREESSMKSNSRGSKPKADLTELFNLFNSEVGTSAGMNSIEIPTNLRS